MYAAKMVAWMVALASLAVGGSAVADRMAADGKPAWSWAYLAFLLAVSAGAYAQLSPAADPAARYLRRLKRHVRDMETTGIATQSEFVLRLRSTCVDVLLRPATPQEAAAGRPGTGGEERRTLGTFLGAGDGRVFAVLGGPGTGKTTLLRATAGALSGRRGEIPILLYLRDHVRDILANPGLDLAELEARAYWARSRSLKRWIRAELEGDGCVVMLDGLNEIRDPSERAAVVAWLRRQIDRYPGNDYLLTSRPHAYVSNPLPGAEVLQVCPYTDEQIAIFSAAWHYAIECSSTGTAGAWLRAAANAKADRFLGRLRSHPALHEMAASPLLLTMMANVHRYRDALPGGRAALYSEICEVLVHRRDEAMNLPDPTGLSGAQKEHLMGVLALTMMERHLRDISREDACSAISGALESAAPHPRAPDFLNAVSQSGLLIEHEPGRYRFAFLPLQECLAAARIPPDGGPLLDHVDDPWWRETTLLWAASSDVTPVVDACLAADTVQSLTLAFDCVQEGMETGPETAERLMKALALD